MSDPAVQSAASAWRAPPPHEWDTSDRVPEMAPAEISFGELLSGLNPLQHIPVVGSIYREITGETLHPVARVIGGALIGGPLGLVASAFNSLIEQATGRDLGAHALALILPDSTAQPAATAIASAEPTPAEPATTVTTASPPPAAEPAATVAATSTPMWPTPVADLAAVAPAAGAATKTGSDAVKAAMPAGEPQGRSLAYYQNHAGQRLPNVGNTTSQRTAMTATPNPTLQRQPLAAPAAAPAPLPTPVRAADPAADAANEPADVWFAHAMMQGLDRYRETKRAQHSEPAVDVTH